MEGYTRKDEGCPQLLELRLGPPGEDWIVAGSNTSRERNHNSLSSLGYLPASQKSPWRHQTNASPFLNLHHHHPQGHSHLAPVTKESSQPRINRAEAQSADKKNAFSPGPPNTALASNGSTQKRTAPAPVVGWPPIRSFRKNIASVGSSSKPASDSSDPALAENATRKLSEIPPKGLFVKINVEGIPIGRKVDLRAYDSYEKLSLAVDKLFRGLLAAQSDSMKDGDGGKEIGGLLDGSGEYTLVYEDNEGDRMLVGDVPWDMFVSTVKRLRVLKSSELPMLSRKVNRGGSTLWKLK